MIREVHPNGYSCLAHMDGKDLLDPINGKWLKHYYALKKKEITKLPLLFNEFYVSLFFFPSSNYVTRQDCNVLS